ncbi:MAG: hypothetical protein R6U03_05790 [Gillisia sp.]
MLFWPAGYQSRFWFFTQPVEHAIIRLSRFLCQMRILAQNGHTFLRKTDTGSGNDTHSLAPVALQTKKLLQAARLIVMAEIRMVFTVYNLVRWVRIPGMANFIKAINQRLHA